MSYTNAKRVLAFLGLVSGGVFLTQSCGKSSSGSSSDSATNPLIQIKMSLSEAQAKTSLSLLSDPNELNLTGSAPGGVVPDSGTISYTLTGCASGLTGTPASQSVVNVYLHDTGCYLKLVAFTLHGTVYNLTNSGAVAFSPALSSGVTGQVATFAGSSATDLITITNLSQLSSTISTSDYVSYEFTIIKVGTNSASITVGTPQSLYTAGQDAPNFKILASNISFDTITAGVGFFTFTVTCSTGTSGNNGIMTGPTFSFCPTVTGGATPNGVDVNSTLNAFSYKLILDASGVGTLTMAAAQAAFASGDSTVSVPSKLIVNSAANTGFITNSLAGPGLMATPANAKMLLVLQAKNTVLSGPTNSSYQYFPVTYTPVTP